MSGSVTITLTDHQCVWLMTFLRDIGEYSVEIIESVDDDKGIPDSLMSDVLSAITDKAMSDMLIMQIHNSALINVEEI